ncbi:hypothetical protein MPTK1_1g18820 [Marchantia polymorpha subsp. ruderalis]
MTTKVQKVGHWCSQNKAYWKFALLLVLISALIAIITFCVNELSLLLISHPRHAALGSSRSWNITSHHTP